MPVSTRIIRFCALLFGLVLLAACERGPDETTLKGHVQEGLEKNFKPGLFQITDFRRRGSAPYLDEKAPGDRLLVYYDAELTFAEDYNFTAAKNLNLGTLERVLGAADEGIVGMNGQGNKAGDKLEVHGTGTYLKEGETWVPVAYVAETQKPAPEVAGFEEVKSTGDTLVTRLSKMLDSVKGAGFGEDGPIIEDELSAALRNIQLRIDRKQPGVFSLLTATPGGEYDRLGQAVHRIIVSPDLQIRSYTSRGSAENVVLVQRRLADFALAQNNVAALAFQGLPPFTAEMRDLRALGSVFPEPIQIIVLEKSEIRGLPDLKGKRIDIGLAASGGRIDALNVIRAMGLGLDDFAEVREIGITQAIEDLKAGRIDAFFTTRNAPATQIQDLAATHPIRLLSLGDEVIKAMVAETPHYVAAEIPARTYPGQTDGAKTLAAVAMVIVNKNTPAKTVDRVIKVLSTHWNEIVDQTLARYTLFPVELTTGLSIPLHPGAKRQVREALEPPS